MDMSVSLLHLSTSYSSFSFLQFYLHCHTLYKKNHYFCIMIQFLIFYINLSVQSILFIFPFTNIFIYSTTKVIAKSCPVIKENYLFPTRVKRRISSGKFSDKFRSLLTGLASASLHPYHIQRKLRKNGKQRLLHYSI